MCVCVCVLLTGGVLVGLMYSLTYAKMIAHLGMEHVILINGLINTSFALGGVIAGCMFYYTDLG